MSEKEIEIFCPASQAEWRQWLHENHQSKQSVWLVYYRKKTGVPTLTWSEAVDEALCFGWIDSVKKTRDHETFIQLFSKRKAKGTWSKVNKDKIERLSEAKLMMQAGLDAIEVAKQNGSWTFLDDTEELIIPQDLEDAFATLQGSKDFFLSLSKSSKKAILHRLVFARQQATRDKRITEIMILISQKMK